MEMDSCKEKPIPPSVIFSAFLTELDQKAIPPYKHDLNCLNRAFYEAREAFPGLMGGFIWGESTGSYSPSLQQCILRSFSNDEISFQGADAFLVHRENIEYIPDLSPEAQQVASYICDKFQS